MFQNKTLRELLLVAGLWLMACAAQAAPQPGPAMPIGVSAMPPRAYVDFCQRKPLDCGADARLVLAQADRADDDWRQLLSLAAPGRAPRPIQPASLAPPPPQTAQTQAADGAEPSPLTVEIPARAAFALDAPLVDLAARTGAVTADDSGIPIMTPSLWALIRRVNEKTNENIVGQTDLQTYGVADYWNTPLEDGRHAGDCEDYVLEKQRALAAAGVPRRALNIALVQTARGENHAVLLVATSEGEFVLDNLTPWVSPWRDAPYFWVKRQVNGEAFSWAIIDDPARRDDVSSRILIALAR